MLVVGIVGASGEQERVVPVDMETKHSLKDFLNILIQRPVFVTSMYGLMFSAALYIPGVVSVYFFTYVMKNLALASAVAPIQLVGLLLGIFLSAVIFLELGKKRSYIVAAWRSSLFCEPVERPHIAGIDLHIHHYRRFHLGLLPTLDSGSFGRQY